MPRADNVVAQNQGGKQGPLPGVQMVQVLQEKRSAYLETLPTTVSAEKGNQLLNYMMLLYKSDELSKCTIDSLREGALEVMRLGLDPRPKAQLLSLIPRKNKDLGYQRELHVDVTYQGFREIAHRNGYRNVVATVLHINDDFTIEHRGGGSDQIDFRYTKWFARRDENGDPLHLEAGEPFVVVVTWNQDDDPPGAPSRVMDFSYAELLEYKKRSPSGKDNRGAWKTDEAAMVRKTAIRRWFPWIKQTEDVAYVREKEDREEAVFLARQNGDPDHVSGLLPDPTMQAAEETHQQQGREAVENYRPETDRPTQPPNQEQEEEEIEPTPAPQTTGAMNPTMHRVLAMVRDYPASTAEELAATDDSAKALKPETVAKYLRKLEEAGQITLLEGKAVPTL